MIKILRATPDDVAKVAAIYTEAIDWLDSQGIHQWRHTVYPTIETAQTAFAENSLFVVFDDDFLVATLILNERQDEQYKALSWQDQTGRPLVLHTLIVRPSATGRGFARQIMAFVQEYALAGSFTSIRLDAFPDNSAATRLYLSSGFQFVGKVYFASKEPGYEWYDCYEKLLSADAV